MARKYLDNPFYLSLFILSNMFTLCFLIKTYNQHTCLYLVWPCVSESWPGQFFFMWVDLPTDLRTLVVLPIFRYFYAWGLPPPVLAGRPWKYQCNSKNNSININIFFVGQPPRLINYAVVLQQSQGCKPTLSDLRARLFAYKQMVLHFTDSWFLISDAKIKLELQCLHMYIYFMTDSENKEFGYMVKM